MRLVYYPGVWDLLHVGHVQALSLARLAGDKLVVGVPSDEVVVEDKGEPPIIPLSDRVTMLKALRMVDEVLPYYRLEFLTHLNLLRPQALAIGETWGNAARHVEADKWCLLNGCRLLKIPRYPNESTSAIKQRIRGR